MKDERSIIGRSRECGILGTIVARAAAGTGGVALVGGEAGIGKTRLVQAVVEGCGLPRHTARMIEGAGSPFHLPLELLRQTPPRAISPPVRALLKGRQVGEADIPFLPAQLVDALCELAAGGPALILLEDLNWADAATLELLPHLAARIEPLPLALLLTYRSDGLGRDHPLRRMNVQLRRLPNVTELQLKPLSSGDTAALAEEILGGAVSPGLRLELHRRTGGLPLFVEELCRALAQRALVIDEEGRFALPAGDGMPVPDSVRDAVLQRLGDLSDETRVTIECAAVAGTEFEMELLLSLGATHDAVDELLGSGVLTELPGGKGAFLHALLREAVLDEIPWSRRRDLNAALAPLLARRRVSQRVVAEHFRLAGRNDEAREAFLEHARASCRLHAYRDAAEAFERALELWPEDRDPGERIGCLERFAQCAQVGGDLAKSARAWREVLGSQALQADPARLAAAWQNLASVYELQSAGQQALSARRSAFDCFREAGADAEAAREALAIAEADMLNLQLAQGIREAEDALAHARAAGNVELEADALSLLGLGLGMQGHPVEARRKVEAGLELALRHNSRKAAAAAYQRLPYVHGYRSDYHGQREAFGEAMDFCDRESLESERAACLACMAYAMFRTGDWKGSGEVAREAFQARKREGGFDTVGGLVLGMLAAMRGELKRARRLLSESDAAARRLGLAPAELVTRAGLAMCEELAGDDEGAARRYRDLRHFWEGTEDQLDILLGLCRAATLFARRREREELAACADAARRIAAANAHPEALGSLAFILGEAALLEGQPAEAASHFRRAREQFERSDLKPDLMRCDWREGEALRLAGKPDAAVDALRRAYREARALGARPLMATLAATLDAMGKPPTEERDAKAPARHARAGLTQRQKEVASLIAGGLTNKEIASELGLSTRTIDMHVGNILDRLNCRSRSEAVRKLVESGVVE